VRLRDKVALVTGAAGDRSIGRGIAQALVDEGARVVLNDVARPEKLAARVAELTLANVIRLRRWLQRRSNVLAGWI
jgi:NAD(P)-dependent dehydrogenase (short-subunit alcohol dehydrogenase family)